MPVKSPSLVVAAVLFWAVASTAAEAPATATISVDEIEAGMTGYGLTVIEGSEPQRFEVEVLGVIPNISPDRDAILFRASGLGLEHSGIFGGMSGSPVYIDGRLAGAVSFGWGWQKDPVAGLTPIADMRKGAAMRGRAASGAPLLTSDRLLAVVDGRPAIGPVAAAAGGPAAPVTLSVSGLSPAARRLLGEFFPSERFALSQTAPAGGAEDPDSPLEAPGQNERETLVPGSSIYAALATGDAFLGAVGTVTDVQGDQVYGFGHPFLNLDSVAMPMYSAEVLTVFASTSRSFKIAVPKRRVGAVTRDFTTGIYGILGARADMFPVEIKVKSDGSETIYRFEIFRHFAISPQVLAVLAAESLTVLAGTPIEATIDYRLEVSYEGGRQLTVSRVEAGSVALQDMARDLAGLLNITMYNPLEKLLPESVSIEASVEGVNRTARIESVRLRETEVYPGDTVALEVRVKPVLGDAETFTLQIEPPETAAPRTVSVIVCDGRTSNRLDLLEAKSRLDPETINDLLDVLQGERDARQLVIRLSGTGYGLSMGGAEFPNLPPSALAVLAAPGDTSLGPLVSSVVTAIDTPYVLTGRKVVPVMIKPPSEEK